MSDPTLGLLALAGTRTLRSADVRRLVALGADPNDRRYGATALHSMVLDAAGVVLPDVDCIRALLDAGADPHAVDAAGMTPFEVLARVGTSVHDARGQAAVLAAMRLLFERGARPPKEISVGLFIEAFTFLLTTGVSLRCRGGTLLHHIAQTARLEHMRVLIEREADLNALDDCGRTPLEVAQRSLRNLPFSESKQPLTEMIALLRDHGARAGVPVPASDDAFAPIPIALEALRTAVLAEDPTWVGWEAYAALTYELVSLQDLAGEATIADRNDKLALYRLVASLHPRRDQTLLGDVVLARWQSLVVNGDLSVKGHLRVDGDLVVTGNLTVDGVCDGEAEITVAGDVSCLALCTQMGFTVGGEVVCDWVTALDVDEESVARRVSAVVAIGDVPNVEAALEVSTDEALLSEGPGRVLSREVFDGDGALDVLRLSKQLRSGEPVLLRAHEQATPADRLDVLLSMLETPEHSPLGSFLLRELGCTSVELAGAVEELLGRKAVRGRKRRALDVLRTLQASKPVK